MNDCTHVTAHIYQQHETQWWNCTFHASLIIMSSNIIMGIYSILLALPPGSIQWLALSDTLQLWDLNYHLQALQGASRRCVTALPPSIEEPSKMYCRALGFSIREPLEHVMLILKSMEQCFLCDFASSLASHCGFGALPQQILKRMFNLRCHIMQQPTHPKDRHPLNLLVTCTSSDEEL